MEYVPMQGPLPGKQWQPSNASSGEALLSDWCGSCARDKAMREGANIDDCDDGELQDASTFPAIDFKRDSVAVIEHKLMARGLSNFVKTMDAAISASQPAGGV